MLTKKRKFSVVNLSVPTDIKEEFASFAYAIGSNPTDLMRMLMKQIIRTKKITFEVEPVLDLEFEPLDTSNWPDELIKKTDKITNELEELFDNYDKRGK